MNHDKINQKIQALEFELAGLKAELSEVDKFKFRYTYTETSFIGTTCVTHKTSGADRSSLENFRYRQTEKNANADCQLQKELMCIGALAEQIDPDYKTKVNWGIDKQFYSIHQDMETKEYQVHDSYPKRRLGVVYMPEAVAEKVCEILNNKEVEL